jgi:hypothetical protein
MFGLLLKHEEKILRCHFELLIYLSKFGYLYQITLGDGTIISSFNL